MSRLEPNSQNGKSPLPGGQARRNKLLVSWGPLVIAAPLAGALLAPLRCAAPCQSRSRATWPPSKYPHPSRAAFAPSVRSRGLSSGGRAGDFSIEIDCSRKADRGLVPHRRLYRLAAAPTKGGVHLPDGVCVEGMTRAVDVPLRFPILKAES